MTGIPTYYTTFTRSLADPWTIHLHVSLELSPAAAAIAAIDDLGAGAGTYERSDFDCFVILKGVPEFISPAHNGQNPPFKWINTDPLTCPHRS